MTPVNGDWLYGGLNNTEWTEDDNWYKYVVSGGIAKWEQVTNNAYPTASCPVYILNPTNDMCVSDNNNCTVNVGNSAAEGLTVASGATLNLGSGQITLTGDIVNNGTLNASATRVKLSGSANKRLTLMEVFHLTS